MPTLISSRRRALGSARMALGAATLFLAACRDGAPATAPLADGPARIAMSASVSQGTAASAEVRVGINYLRQAGSRVFIGSQSLVLNSNSEQLPLAIDLSSCLRDGTRAGTGGTTPAADECVIQLDVQLLLDGLSVDRQLIGPLTVRPGGVTTVDQPLVLSDVKEIRITAPIVNVVAPGQPLRVEVARTMALTAQVLDGTQRVLVGRLPLWTSSAPSIATVNASGLVTALSPGNTQITADVGGRVGVVDVRVVAQPQLLSVRSSGFSGTGTVRSQPGGIDCAVTGALVTGACTIAFPGDAQVILTATAGSGTELAGWAGDCSATQGSICTIGTDQARTVGVVFRALRTLTVTGAGTGVGTVTSDQGNIACAVQNGGTAGTCASSFIDGAVVTLTASPVGQSTFSGWTGACAGTSGTSCRLTMTEARTATARFDAPVPVTITGTGLGAGVVVSSPAGVSCNLQASNANGSCIALFAGGSTITLTATAADQNTFRSWGGACATATGTTCVLPITGTGVNVSVRIDAPASLTVTPSGTGDGLVLGGGAISCTRTNGVNTGRCATDVSSASRFLLLAVPGAQSEFTGWSGACSGTDDCQVTVEGATAVGATFRRRQVPIALELRGPNPGSVQVNSEPPCVLPEGELSRTCIVQVDIGRTAVLTATPAGSQTFGDFSGACVSSTATCSFTVNGPSSITARFGAPTSSVTISPSSLSTGNGLVENSSAGISCGLAGTMTGSGGSCVFTVPANNLVSLTASPSSGFAFVEWGGACAASGSSTLCSFTATAGNISVTARFAPVPSINEIVLRP